MGSGTAEPNVAGRGKRRADARVPQISVTKYEVVSSALTALALMFGIAVVTLIAIWLANRLPTKVLLEPVMTAGDGGWEDGSPDASLNVESPEDPSSDPSLADDASESQLMEITDPVTELTERSAEVVEATSFIEPDSAGTPGSATGTGGRPLGSGGPGRGGAKREQRWIFEYDDKRDLQAYAKQLDFFGIELGLVLPNEGRLIYLSGVSTDTPKIREVRTGESEKRLFTSLMEGDREADLQLLRKAGLNPDAGRILQFFPPELESRLFAMEMAHLGLSESQIRRTYFRVRETASGPEFYVRYQKPK